MDQREWACGTIQCLLQHFVWTGKTLLTMDLLLCMLEPWQSKAMSPSLSQSSMIVMHTCSAPCQAMQTFDNPVIGSVGYGLVIPPISLGGSLIFFVTSGPVRDLHTSRSSRDLLRSSKSRPSTLGTQQAHAAPQPPQSEHDSADDLINPDLLENIFASVSGVPDEEPVVVSDAFAPGQVALWTLIICL